MADKVFRLRADRLSYQEDVSGDILFLSDKGASLEAAPGVILSRALRDEGYSLLFYQNSPFWFDRSCLKRFGLFLRRLSSCKTIHCNSSKIFSFWKLVVPATVLGRFFGCRVVLQFSSSNLIDHVSAWKFLTLPFLRLAERIVVESRLSAYGLTSLGLKSISRIAPLHNDKITRRLVTSVQPRLLVISRLDDDHNPLCALKAFELVKQKYPRTELTFVGEGALRSSLESFIAERRLHGVEFMLPKDEHEMAILFQSSDLFINCASRSAGIKSLIDACFSGLPIVTSEESNAMELIDDKRNGLVFGINEHVALANSIIKLVESPQLVTELSEQSARESKKYDWSAVQNDWLALYPQLK